MNSQFPMIKYVLSAIVILLTYLYSKLVYLPKKRQAWYKKHLEELGYKVYEIPFMPFQISFISQFKRLEAQKQDSLWLQKNVFPKYDVVLMNAFNYTCLNFINPELVKQLMTPDKIATYHKVPLFIRGVKLIIGEGLAFSEDQRWRRKRIILSKVFNFDLLNSITPKIGQIFDHFLDQMEAGLLQKEALNNSKNEFEVNIVEMGNCMFSAVMMACFFGSSINFNKKIDGQLPPTFFFKIFGESLQMANDPLILLFGETPLKLGVTSYYRDFRRRLNLLKEYSLEIVRERIEKVKLEGKPQTFTDIIQALYWTGQESKDQAFTQHEIVEEFLTFIIAGSDTSACAFGQMVNRVIENPAVEVRLRKEIDQVITSKNNQKDINTEQLKQLEYIDWCQNQAIRMGGPTITGFLLREATVDHYVKNIPISKGTGVTFCQHGSCYNPDIFPNPFEFRPERWEKECQNNHPFSFVHFSGGPRNCIGKFLSLLESKIAIIKLMQRYGKMSVPAGQKAMAFKTTYCLQSFKTKLIKCNNNEEKQNQ